MKIVKISELIKALEYSKENLQTDDLSQVFTVNVENQGRENGVYITDPAIFTEDDGDPTIEVRIIATDVFKNLFTDDEPSRKGRSWE
ncbi:hypothetical protein V6B05_01795 [Lactococcus garvieae]|uniref:hypothetical protein n=1 Tax=Lactococcus garvieae TaxID=1363 RepID=UPI001F620AEB|nr:hypothetical protein [Lactococcus garvieae]MCI3860158.1 hypothetical protein [Lactococcus garvieae]